MALKKVSFEEQEKAKNSSGNFDLALLQQWGVTVPPVKGWRKRLALGQDPNVRIIRNITTGTGTQQQERA